MKDGNVSPKEGNSGCLGSFSIKRKKETPEVQTWLVKFPSDFPKFFHGFQIMDFYTLEFSSVNGSDSSL